MRYKKLLLVTNICACILCSLPISSQSKDSLYQGQEQRLHYKSFVSFAYIIPNVSGSGFYGNNLKASYGLNAEIQLGLYKGLYLGGGYEYISLERTSSQPFPEYRTEGSTGVYMFVGYEYFFLNHFIVGAKYGFLSDARYRNIVFSPNEQNLIDDAEFQKFSIYFEYVFYKVFSVFANYTFREDRMNINLPEVLQPEFDKVRYNNINLGLRIRFLDKGLMGYLSS